MAKAQRLTRDERQTLIAESRKGLGTKALSGRYGISERAVRYALAAEKARKKTVQGKDVTVSVRLDVEDLRGFDVALGRLGFRSRSEALRRMIRGAAGFFAPDDHLGEQVRQASVELSKLGTNVNQIARRLNAARLAGAPVSVSADEAAELRRTAILVADLREDLTAVIHQRQKQVGSVLADVLTGDGAESAVRDG